MKTKHHLALLLCTVIVLSSCRNNAGNKNYGKDPGLYDIRFELIELNQTMVKSSGKAIDITFVSKDNVISGSTGCNSYSGMWTVRKDFMKMIPLRVTEMVCLQGMETEKAYLEMIRSADRYSHDVKSEDGAKVHYLRLFSKDMQVAVFKSASSPRP